MREEIQNNEEMEIDLRVLFFELLKRWKLVVALTVLGALLAFGYSGFFLVPQYESTAELYVLTKSTSITSLADIQMGSNLTNDYIVVVKGRPVLDQVIENLKLSETYETLEKKIELNNPARNAGLEIAAGEYIAFVDSDDFVHECYIEEFLKIIEEQDCDIAICGFQKFMDGRSIENKELKHTIKCLQPVECYRSTDAFYDVAWNKLYKRSVIGDIRYPYRKLHEDIYTTYKIIFSAERIGTTEDELYYYRQRGDSIIGNQTGAPEIDIEEALWERINFFKSAVYKRLMVWYDLSRGCSSCSRKFSADATGRKVSTGFIF